MIQLRWPFTRVPEPDNIRTIPVSEWWRSDWDKVKELYPAGIMLPFLNTQLLVTGYRYEEDGTGLIHPVMLTAFRDAHGILHEWKFTEHNISLLVAKTPVKK